MTFQREERPTVQEKIVQRKIERLQMDAISHASRQVTPNLTHEDLEITL